MSSYQTIRPPIAVRPDPIRLTRSKASAVILLALIEVALLSVFAVTCFGAEATTAPSAVDANAVADKAGWVAEQLTARAGSVVTAVTIVIGILTTLAVIVRLLILAYRSGGWPGVGVILRTILEHLASDVRAGRKPDITTTEGSEIEKGIGTTVKLAAWSLVLAILICLVQSGCSGYESSPWGPTQKANPGTRIQYGASGLDVGATADSQAKVSGFEVVKPDGTKVKCDTAEFGQKPSDTRLADVKQLEATGAIQAIHWAGINAMTSTIASAIPGLAGLLGRNDVPQDAKNTLQSVLQSLTTAQQQVYQGAQVLQTMGLLPVTTTSKSAEVGPPAPSTQPVK